MSLCLKSPGIVGRRFWPALRFIVKPENLKEAKLSDKDGNAPPKPTPPERHNAPFENAHNHSPHTGRVHSNDTAPRVQKFTVFRYDPKIESVPRFEVFDVDVQKAGPMILDALLAIKNGKDSTLSFRRSCREGICGSCAMNIDGKNALACITPIDIKREQGHHIQPLPHMFVLRDLVPDLSQFYLHYKKIQPWLQRSDDAENHTTETTQTIEDRKKLDGSYECIMCACCSTSCPSQWWHPDTFLGPQALLSAYRWVSDSRDEEKAARLAELNDTMKMYRCHNIGNCTDCCPKGLNPSEAIAHLKKMVEENFVA